MGTIGIRIKQERLRRGETQSALARRAGVSRSSIAALERGLRGLSTWTLTRLALALGGTEAWLQTGIDESPLCAEVATIPVEDIQDLIRGVRAHAQLFTGAAARVEAWLRESVENSIPF